MAARPNRWQLFVSERLPRTHRARPRNGRRRHRRAVAGWADRALDRHNGGAAAHPQARHRPLVGTETLWLLANAALWYRPRRSASELDNSVIAMSHRAHSM